MEPNLLFVYGILKRGYELDLEQYGAKFISEAHIPGAALYGIGRRWDHESHPNDGREFSGVGLRLNIGPKWVAHGELFEIPDNLWNWLDGIENNGHTYERKVAKVDATGCLECEHGNPIAIQVDAWVYEHMYKFEMDMIKSGGQIRPIKGGVF